MYVCITYLYPWITDQKSCPDIYLYTIHRVIKCIFLLPHFDILHPDKKIIKLTARVWVVIRNTVVVNNSHRMNLLADTAVRNDSERADIAALLFVCARVRECLCVTSAALRSNLLTDDDTDKRRRAGVVQIFTTCLPCTVLGHLHYRGNMRRADVEIYHLVFCH